MELIKNLGIKDTGKAAGIVSYFTIVGWFVAYFAFHRSRRTDLGSYQLRQTLLLHILFMVFIFGLPFLFGTFWTAAGVFSLSYFLRLLEFVFFILWLVGLFGAINGEKKSIPIVGEKAQTLFSNI
jgi:uncharacterized membrane protein